MKPKRTRTEILDDLVMLATVARFCNETMETKRQAVLDEWKELTREPKPEPITDHES